MPYTDSILQITKNPLGFLAEASQKYGDIVPLRCLKYPVYLLTHPDYIKSIFITHHGSMKQGRAHRKLRPLLGNGLLTSNGDEHRKNRKEVQPAFHHKRIRAYTDAMRKETEECMCHWQAGEKIDLFFEIKKIALNIAQKILFGKKISIGAQEMHENTHSVNAYVIKESLNPLPRTRQSLSAELRFKKSIAFLQKTLGRFFEENKADSFNKESLLSMIMDEEIMKNAQKNAQNKSQNKSQSENDFLPKALRDQAMTFFLAGYETTANALLWTLCLLAKDPQAEKKLVSELEAVIGRRPLCLEDVPRLIYTEKVFLESLRLYPPAWITARTVISSIEIGGRSLPQGAEVLTSQYLSHRDTRWFAEPEKFLPERWTPAFRESLPKCAYFPFGAGLRQCIGEHFARLETIVVISSILQRWKLHLDLDSMPPLNPQISLSPQTAALPVTLIKREAA